MRRLFLPNLFKASALATAATIGLLGLFTVPAAAQADTGVTPVPFNPEYPTVYIAQGSPTQLNAAIQKPGGSVFQTVGAPVAPAYNGIGYNDSDDFIYGYTSVPVAGQTTNMNHLVRIGSKGNVTLLGPIGVTGTVMNAGAVLGEELIGYVSNSSGGGTRTLNATNIKTGVTRTIALQNHSITAQDITPADGYLWGIQYNSDQLIRVDPTTGETLTITVDVPKTRPSSYGAAWTYGNGNIAFSKNESGDITQISLENPGSAAPIATVVSVIDGPKNANNDGTISAGRPADLSLTKTVAPAVAMPGDSVTYTLTATNNGVGASSGFVVTDTLPEELINIAPGNKDLCTVNNADSTVQCVGGNTPVGGTATFTITGEVAGDKYGPIYNAASVLGNEADPKPENNSASATLIIGLSAADNESLGNTPGSAPKIKVITNDTGDIDPTSVRIMHGNNPTTRILVPGEGTWNSDNEGNITFTPEDGYQGNPTPITYQVANKAGLTDTATVTITYVVLDGIEGDDSDNGASPPDENDSGITPTAGDQDTGGLVITGDNAPLIAGAIAILALFTGAYLLTMKTIRQRKNG